jgi:hypothetical protein
MHRALKHRALKMVASMLHDTHAYPWVLIALLLGLVAVENLPHEATASLGTQSVASFGDTDLTDLPVMYD